MTHNPYDDVTTFPDMRITEYSSFTEIVRVTIRMMNKTMIWAKHAARTGEIINLHAISMQTRYGKKSFVTQRIFWSTMNHNFEKHGVKILTGIKRFRMRTLENACYVLERIRVYRFAT